MGRWSELGHGQVPSARRRRTPEAVALLPHALTLPRAPADMYVQLAELTIGATPPEQIRPLLEIALLMKPGHGGAEALLSKLGPSPAANEPVVLSPAG